MPNVHTTLRGLFSDIADAIRAKTGGTGDIVADSFPTAIATIPTGSQPVLQEITVTENRIYTPPQGTDGFSRVVVNQTDAMSGNIVTGKTILGVEGSAKKLTTTASQYTVSTERSYIGLSGVGFPMAVYVASEGTDAAALAEQKNKPVIWKINALPLGAGNTIVSITIITPEGNAQSGICLCYCDSTRTRFYRENAGTVFTEAIFPSGLTYSWEAYHWQRGDAV